MATTVLGAGIACAQPATIGAGPVYPAKPIRFVTAGVGGGADFTSRIVATAISSGIGQQVIVDNRAFAGQATDIVSKALRDGYVVLVTGQSFWVGPLLQPANYDPLKDFSPVTLINRQPNVLVVHPTVAVNSVTELIALAKSKPGELNYSSGSSGSASHLAAELFKSMGGVHVVRIPYKNGGLRMAGLTGGEVQMEFATPGSVIPQIKAGRLRALAVTTSQPSPVMPGLPTVTATGLPGYESTAVYAMFAPAGTPVAIIRRLNDETTRVLAREDIKEKFLSAGIEAAASTPLELSTAIKSEMTKLGKVIKDAGITLN
jgi:tripartite-type tricarboxylate transporter receptor subunit TctC